MGRSGVIPIAVLKEESNIIELYLRVYSIYYYENTPLTFISKTKIIMY